MSCRRFGNLLSLKSHINTYWPVRTGGEGRGGGKGRHPRPWRAVTILPSYIRSPVQLYQSAEVREIGILECHYRDHEP